MRTELAFAGSEVAAVSADGDALRLRFAAASVSDGWLTGLDLVLAGARWHGALGDALGRIAAGRLRVDGVDRRLAIPCELAGDVSLDLRFGNGAALEIRARALAMRTPEAPRSFDDHAC